VLTIQKVLSDSNIQRKTRRGAKPHWNYHEVQADLSFLVGCGLLGMSRPKTKLTDRQTMTFAVDRRPRYWLKDENEAKRVLSNKGILEKVV